ncbi:MAG: type II methionyl aminopeptidase [Candidatus Micrarchaeota archaeon]
MVEEDAGAVAPEEESGELKSYLEAARVAVTVQDIARDLVVEGAKLLVVADKIESEVIENGGRMAFPTNISINEEAAHYTPCLNDEKAFGAGDVVKVDFGVHVDGFIIDQAFTVDLSGENGKLVEASEKALQEALAVMKAGVNVSAVGKAIASVIEAAGFKPIENLSGHKLENYLLHAGEEIPNVERGDYVLKEGDVFAVEPFATTGRGKVIDGSYTEIYSLVNPKPVRMPNTRKLLAFIAEEYKFLPFASRWLVQAISSEPSMKLALADLKRSEVLRSYPVLKEINDGMVSQAETTVMVEKDSVKVLV